VATPAVLRLARADAPQMTLKLHHAFSAVSAVHEKFLAPWARKVEADCGNRISIDLFPSMQLGGAPAALFDQARDGIADIVWAPPSATPGRFAKSETFELPFVLSHRALVNSKALADFAATNLQDEFRDFYALCFSCRDHGVLHTSRPIKSIDDLRGLRLHAPNRLAGECMRALGAHGVSVPSPQVPMALSTRVIDGCLDPWDAVPSLRLGENLKQHTDFVEQALSSAPFVLAMCRRPTSACRARQKSPSTTIRVSRRRAWRVPCGTSKPKQLPGRRATAANLWSSSAAMSLRAGARRLSR